MSETAEQKLDQIAARLSLIEQDLGLLRREQAEAKRELGDRLERVEKIMALVADPVLASPRYT